VSSADGPRAAVLVTGDEILAGRIRDRNSATLAASLASRGVGVQRVLAVGDDLEAIVDGLSDLLATRPDLIVTSGGLGPTHDDRTMQAVAEVTGRPLEVDPAALLMVRRARATLRGIEQVPQEVRRRVEEKQAALPRGAQTLEPAGTAPGCVVVHDGVPIVVLPGPPWELAVMWEAALSGSAAVGEVLDRAVVDEEARLLRLYGVVESEVVEALDRSGSDGLRIGVCARAGETEVSVRGPASAVAGLEAAFEDRFGARLYSRNGESALEVVARRLAARGETLAVAESCTGGLLGGLLTSLPGSSVWFVGGVVAYANELKQALLGVAPETLAGHGAVSAECAREMALGARAATGASWAVSVTGVAGPAGGTPEKPVGLVYLGVAAPDGRAWSEERRWPRGDRERIRERAAAVAVHLVREALG
jgi:nicotinamide-nucleotide amidase